MMRPLLLTLLLATVVIAVPAGLVTRSLSAIPTALHGSLKMATERSIAQAKLGVPKRAEGLSVGVVGGSHQRLLKPVFKTPLHSIAEYASYTARAPLPRTALVSATRSALTPAARPEPTPTEVILSPDSIPELEEQYCMTLQNKGSLACHADDEPIRKWEDFEKFPGEEGNLGSGASGQVEKVKVKGDDASRVFARKIYSLEIGAWRVLNELTISTMLSHDLDHHFVKPYYFFQRHTRRNRQNPRLVMEYVAGGHLSQLIGTVKRVHWEDTIPLAYFLLHALEYAHSQGVMYRDMKPDNILLDAETGFKITDFDQAARFKEKGYPEGPAGTEVYMPPEYFLNLNEQHTETVDTWGVGAVLWTAIEGRPMHKDNSMEHIEETFRKLAIPKEGLGALYRNLLNKLLEFESFDEMAQARNRLSKLPGLKFLEKAPQPRKKRLTCAEILESEEGKALFSAYEKETGKKLTELAFSPEVVEGQLKGYNYHGHQHEHYHGVLDEDSNFIPIVPKEDGSVAT